MISSLLPGLLERVNCGEKLALLRDSTQKSISLSTRDALLGDWNAIVNRVFDGEDDLQQILFHTLKDVFHKRLEGIIQSRMGEIEQNVAKGLSNAIAEFEEDGVFNFTISNFIWSQNDSSDNSSNSANDKNSGDWARKNLSLRAKSFHPIIVTIVQMAAERFDWLLKDRVKKTGFALFDTTNHSARM